MDGQLVKKKKQEDLLMEAKNFFNANKKEIGQSIRSEQRVIQLSFSQLSEFSPTLSDSTIESPEQTVAVLENALDELGLIKSPRLRFVDLPHTAFVKIREMRSKHLDQLIWIEGIVRQASDVRPQVVNAKFECPSCGALLSVLQIDKKFREPSRCTCGWKSSFKLISKEMVDTQRLVIEESPDALEGGEQPRRISVFLKEDLVEPKMEERTTPGSKVKIFGVLKEVPVPLPTGSISTRFDLAVEANNIIPLEESFEELDVSEDEEDQIIELSADPNLFHRLSSSLAPSIYGFERVKESVLLQMFSGIKKTKSDGGSTRGDIHILLVGDPGVAKSVMLKFASTIAPKGRYVSGKAATAAGMCVAPKSLILTNPGGMSNIQDVVEPRITDSEEYAPGVWKEDNIKDIKIQSLSNELKIHSKNPSKIWKLKAPEQVYEIFLSSGKRVELTGNTSLLSLSHGRIEWAKSSDIKLGDYIATPRKLIGGHNDRLCTAELIDSNPVVHGVKSFVHEIVCILKSKYGSIREAAGKLGVNENNLYHNWVIEESRGNIKLKALRKIAEAAGLEWRDKARKISLYNGKIHEIPEILDKDIIYIAGLLAGDGDIRKEKSGSYSVRLSNETAELQEFFRKILKERFSLKFGVTKGNEKRPEATRAHSRILGEVLIKLGIPVSPKSSRIFMPECLLHLKNNLLAEYIAGLYDSDGSVYIRRGIGSDCIELTICSETLARQLQLALLRFEIHASLRSREPNIKGIKGNYKRWIVKIWSLENIKRFAKNIPLKHPIKKEKMLSFNQVERVVHSNMDVLPGVGEVLKGIIAKNNLSQKKLKWHKNLTCSGLRKILSRIKCSSKEFDELRRIANSDIFWEKVADIKIKKPVYDFVYDLTVEDSHNFIVDGVLVHNTAAVVKDEFLRGWSLEAGAMVLSNKGMVAIDEIEKMNEQDRSSMHEAMEQQCVTISKANIHATLRAETTVLAAGNPKLGRFDPYTPIPQQIDISPALLSRFDVIFVIKDIPNKVQDEAIASHVLEEHKQEVIRDIVNPKLLRKYIAYAKKKFKPKLTDEAIEEIKEFYVRLRNQSVSTESAIKPIPITARQLEGIIRLSEAHAKMRLSTEVKREDAKRAIELLKVSLTQVGYDEETKTFDIDKITSGISSSKRGKILLLREILSQLESRLGKLIPIEEIEKALDGKLTSIELEDAVEQLVKSGDMFKPKKGYVQRM